MKAEKNFLENHGGTGKGHLLLPVLRTIELEVLSRGLNQEEKNEGAKNRKEGSHVIPVWS